MDRAFGEDIYLCRPGGPALLDHSPRYRIGPLGAASGHDHFRAAPAERQRRGLADADGATDNDCAAGSRRSKIASR